MTGLDVSPLAEWPASTRRLYDDFCQWLREGGYRDSTVYLYGVAARLALGWLDKDRRLATLSSEPSASPCLGAGPEPLPAAGLERARQAIIAHCQSKATCRTYLKGVAKLGEYLRFRQGEPAPRPEIHWDLFLDPLPGGLAAGVRTYVSLQQCNWLAEERYRATCTLLSHLTFSLRWMARRVALDRLEALTPALWLDYVDARLEAGISQATLNRELRDLQHFLDFLAGEGQPICRRMLDVEPQKTGTRLPRDLPLDRLRRLLRQIEAAMSGAVMGDAATHDVDMHGAVMHDADVDSGPSGPRRQALLDRAWVLLMLHVGLRTGEVRRLRLSDLDTLASLSAGIQGRWLRIEQSKGLKDRVVCLSEEAAGALRDYLEVRGPAASDHVFVYRHRPLSPGYCGKRLRTLDEQGDIRATPHQLRCSCATLLLNAGASVLIVQALLGHKHVDTTLRYARVCDSTVAADYERAMGRIEEGCT